MSDQEKDNRNAFHPDFLAKLNAEDDPPNSYDAERSGFWWARPVDAGFGIFRLDEGPRFGDQADAWLESRHLALLAAAARPARLAAGLELENEHEEKGFPILQSGRVVGHLRYFDEPWANDLALLHGLVSTPSSLALVLIAAGQEALTLAGRQAARMLAVEPDASRPPSGP